MLYLYSNETIYPLKESCSVINFWNQRVQKNMKEDKIINWKRLSKYFLEKLQMKLPVIFFVQNY